MRLLSAGLLLLVLIACSESRPYADVDPASGITGHVIIGPTCPVETEESPCDDRPYEATIIIKDDDGNEVMTVESDSEGLFRAPVPPGTYTLLPLSPNAGAPPFADEQDLVIERGQLTEVIIAYDSGIR